MYGHVPRYLYIIRTMISRFILLVRTGWYSTWRVEKKNKNTKCAAVKGMKQVQVEGGGVFKNRARLVATRAFLGKRGDEILLPGDGGGDRAGPPSPRCQPHTNPTRGRHLPAGTRTSYILSRVLNRYQYYHYYYYC